jgi:hypothetical protein
MVRHSRILGLERRVRALTVWALVSPLLGAGLAVLWLHAARGGSDPAVVTSRVQLKDTHGIVRAELGATGTGFGLTLRDPTGQTRALVETERDGSPRIALAGEQGERLAELIAYLDKAPRLSLASPSGEEFFHVSLNADGASEVSLGNGDGQERAGLRTRGDGTPELVLRDDEGVDRAELSIGLGGAPSLVLEGPDGKRFQAPL